jgi:hypothetical protein
MLSEPSVGALSVGGGYGKNRVKVLSLSALQSTVKMKEIAYRVFRLARKIGVKSRVECVILSDL